MMLKLVTTRPTKRFDYMYHGLLFVLFSVLSSIHILAATPTRGYLPPDYIQPHPPVIDVEPGDPDGANALKITERNHVYHFMDLDRSPWHWADYTLRIAVGFQEQWAPGDYYALLPVGYAAEPNRCITFLSTVKIKFDKPFKGNLLEPMRSVNLPQYTLYTEGGYAILSKGDDRRWYFESVDGEEKWRLAKIELIRQPGHFTTLVYESNRVIAVQFPNGTQATIAYDVGGLPIKICTPFGEIASIKRAAGGFISEVCIAVADEKGQPQKTLRAYRYEHDADGKIIRFVNACGVEQKVEYSVEERVEDKTKKAVYTVVIRNSGDGSYFKRTQEARETGDWTIQDGVGTRQQPLADAQTTQTIRMRKSNHRMMVTSRKRSSANSELNYEVDKFGNPKVQVAANGDTTLLSYNGRGNRTNTVVPGGGRFVASYNEFGQVVQCIDPLGQESLYQYDEHARLIDRIPSRGASASFEYDERGFPRATRFDDGREYFFEFDQWGRLTVLREPKVVKRWTFTAWGAIESESVDNKSLAADAQSQPQTEMTRFHYRESDRRLESITFADGTTQRLAYDKDGRLVFRTRADGKQARYEYDKVGRLVTRSDPGVRLDEYSYHPNGMVASNRFRVGNGTWTEHHFDLEGRLLAEHIAGKGLTQYEYDEWGRQCRIVYPDGTDTVKLYNGQHRLIGLRGSHQPPKDYAYDQRGRRTEVPANDKFYGEVGR